LFSANVFSYRRRGETPAAVNKADKVRQLKARARKIKRPWRVSAQFALNPLRKLDSRRLPRPSASMLDRPRPLRTLRRLSSMRVVALREFRPYDKAAAGEDCRGSKRGGVAWRRSPRQTGRIGRET
jgi:hypothetical protein